MPFLPNAELLSRVERLPTAARLLEILGPTYEPSILVVGGAVRDLLLGRVPKDLDVVIDGPLEDAARRLNATLPHGGRFATARAELGGQAFDLARARREHYGRPGALPTVQDGSLEDDLLRRDFTVNAIAAGLTGPLRGRLIAAPKALADLDARQLRVFHDRSFLDDPTRLIRLARYRSRLGFTTEPHTAMLAAAAIDGGALRTVSGSRLVQELRLLAREPDPGTALDDAAHLGLLVAFGADPRFDGALVRCALGLLPDGGDVERLVLAAALGGLDRDRLDSAGLPVRDRDAVADAHARVARIAGALERAVLPSEIARAAEPVPLELVALAGGLGPIEPARSWLEHLRHVGLRIDGDDLLQAGIPAGPAIGAALAAAREAVLDGRASDREAELAEAVRAAGATG